jgi:lysine 6-dehydrogenase
MNFLVLGSGMMGSAIAYDLAQSASVHRVNLADVDVQRAKDAASGIGSSKINPLALDVNDHSSIVRAMKDNVVAIGAVSYRYNVALSKAAIEAGIHYCDLGGNDDVVEEQLALSDKAKDRRILIVPNCGLAPGLANILAARGAEMFDSVESVRMRVGGLPQHPVPPFNYQIVFSVEGLLNEYSGKSTVIRDFKLTHVDTLTEIEPISFPPPFGSLEAFHTSGGASLTPKMFEGKVRDLDYKTIRYPGHCEKFKMLLEVGFGSNEPLSLGSNVLTERELFIELLKRKLPQVGNDLVLMRVTVEGMRGGRDQRLTFTMIDFYDETRNISAMMRGTGYPTSVIAQFMATGIIKKTGAISPEQCVPLEPLLLELNKRGKNISQEWN